MADEVVTTELRLEAKQALEAYKRLQKEIETTGGSVKNLRMKISDFEMFVDAQARKTNTTFEKQLALFKQLDAQAKASKQDGIFGRTGGADPFAMVQQLHAKREQLSVQNLKNVAAAQAASDALIAKNQALLKGVDLGAIAANTDKVAQGYNKIGTAAHQAGQKGQQGMKLMVGGVNLVRLALSTLLTSGLFAVIAGFVKMFDIAIGGLKKMEVSVYNLANAEKSLSLEGVEITFQELEDVIDRINEKYNGLFAEATIQDAVADIAIATKELNLTAEQIGKIADASAALQLRNPQRSLQEVNQQVLTAILSGQTKGIRSLGVAANEVAIQQKALELGLVAVGEEASAQAKSIATLELVYEATAQDAENLAQYQNTLTGAQQQLSSTFQDLLKETSQEFAPLMIQGLKVLITLVEIASSVLKAMSPIIRDVSINIAAFVAGIKGIGTGPFFLPDIGRFKDQFADAKKAYEEYFASFENVADTPTADREITIDTESARNELEDLLKDLESLQDKMDEKQSDFDLDLARFDEDALIDRQRAVQDYNLNVAQATRDFNNKRAESNRKYHQKEQEEERKFQENMRKLREDFLFSLEDALRERDARQVLRLVDKYNMDKENAIKENELRRQSAAENFALEQAEEKRQLEEKLRVMAEEQALKLQRMDEDSALKRQRMEEDHAIEMERLKAQMDERLQEAATKMAEELGLNEEGAKAIYDLLSQYYGTDGSLAQLTSEGYAAMLENAEGFLGQLTGIVAQQQQLMAQAVSSMPTFGTFGAGNAFGNATGSTGSRTNTRPRNTSSLPAQQVPRYATGGQFIATRATPFIAGEGSENELVTITPFSKLPSMQSSLSGFGGFGGGESTINLGISLSPELKAEIINTALDKTALIIEHVRRER